MGFPNSLLVTIQSFVVVSQHQLGIKIYIITLSSKQPVMSTNQPLLSLFWIFSQFCGHENYYNSAISLDFKAACKYSKC